MSAASFSHSIWGMLPCTRAVYKVVRSYIIVHRFHHRNSCRQCHFPLPFNRPFDWTSKSLPDRSLSMVG